MLQNDTLDRAHGDQELALMIFDLEMEQVQRQQVCDAYENIMNVFKEIVAEVLAAGSDYVTAEQELNCN